MVEIPKLIGPGSPIEIDCSNTEIKNMKGTFYARDIRTMMRHLQMLNVEFRVIGSPMKGPRGIVGNGFEIIDPYKAWLFDDSFDINEVYSSIMEFASILDDDFKNTAGKTFVKMSGKLPWIDECIQPWARAAYTGGIQWSRPGVYLNTTTSDMREAYYWAMHKMPMTKKWQIFYGKKAKPGMNSIICAKVKMNGRNTLPILPTNTGKIGAELMLHGDKTTMEGYWFGPDFMMAQQYMDSCEIHWVAHAQPTFILNKRMNLDPLPKSIRKRLSLVGYGIHAQGERRYDGVFAKNYYEACRLLKSHHLKSTLYSHDDEMSVWWRAEESKRSYVRVDWAGMVTSRVRYRLLQEGFRIHATGGTVARLYVDSITASTAVKCGFGSKVGDFKHEGSGVTIVGPPGIGMIAGAIKHSGIPIDRAMSIIESVKEGTYRATKSDNNWTGLTEAIPT